MVYDIYGNAIANAPNDGLNLAEKVWLPIGDSITQNGSYRNTLTTYEKMRVITGGYGSGRCVSYANGVDYCALEKIGEIADGKPDIITVALGINDYSNNCPIGEITDDPDSQTENSYTFYGCFKKLLKLIWDKYGELIPVVLMTPFHNAGFMSSNGKNHKVSDYADAVKKIGEYFSYPVFDAYAESGVPIGAITEANRLYTNDGLHLNRMAGAYIAPKLATCIRYALGKYDIACTSMGQSAASYELSVDESKSIYVTLSPSGTNTPVVWETSDENVVTVTAQAGQDFTATLHAGAAGSATVTAKCGTVSKQFAITVS
jgi:lysophospholipase L1-like esterase